MGQLSLYSVLFTKQRIDVLNMNAYKVIGYADGITHGITCDDRLAPMVGQKMSHDSQTWHMDVHLLYYSTDVIILLGVSFHVVGISIFSI